MPLLYVCQFCEKELSSVKGYVGHYRLHRNVKNLVFPCCISECNKTFVKFISLKCHISRDHGNESASGITNSIYQSSGLFIRPMSSASTATTSRLTGTGSVSNSSSKVGQIICGLAECRKEMASMKELVSHLKLHMSAFQAIPYSLGVGHPDSTNADTNFGTDVVEVLDLDSETELSCTPEEFKNSLALFFLKMEAIHLIAISTMQLILNDISHLTKLSLDTLQKEVQTAVTDQHERLKIKEVFESNFFLKALSNKGELNTDYKRKQYFKANFNFVEPIEINLGLDKSNQKCVFHYVPIKETLKALFSNKTFTSQYEKPVHNDAGNNTFSDVLHGHSFKNNKYFIENPSALKIVLYQDAFEVVNPLGSAKSKFKLIGFYYTLLDIYPHKRSKIDPMQLCILCKESDFTFFENGQKVLEPLINDIVSLSTGVFMNDGACIKANLVCILGDNLGSHFIGGFNTNFSNSEHRYVDM
ncbi:hypothetical protein LOTGIDRAFT_158065 [Lottia gigantea]|uniref:C2H2-type domain-containing protein n=1 Tax=Lottia gigantea TaxID=225164 RepID=V4ARP7_LOTGI|nr:hypothetical protein LOTGIDRAFT_158065 [Lottia gigantea]ESO99907.1 hypothetical protein LOTGIDRAFT_158065 [Lottia gigantea]